MVWLTSLLYKGWLAKIKLSNPQELEALMDEAQYKEHCANDEH